MPEVRKERQNVDVKCVIQMKHGEGEVGMWEGSGGKRGRWEDDQGKVQMGRREEDGKVGRCKQASSASGDALSHLDTQEVISRMVPVVGLVVTIQ